MTDPQQKKKWRAGAKRVLMGFMAMAILLFAGLYLIANPLLNSPFIINNVSRILSETLRQHTSVRAIRLSGGTLSIKGLAILNPAGFAAGNLLLVRSIEITPDWRKLLTGRKSFSSLRISELRLSMARNGGGAWNFSGITRFFNGRKGGGELFIGRLSMENSTISVEGRVIEDISLSLKDVSTNGTTGSPLYLTFKDEYGDPFRLEGNGRLGEQPDFDMKLASPALTFKALRGLHLPIDTEKGGGNLLLTAGLHGGEMKFSGDAQIDLLTVTTKRGDSPFNCRIAFAGRYEMKMDEAILDSSLIQVGRMLRLHGVGKISGLRKERIFSFDISQDVINAGELFTLIPVKFRNGLDAEGEVLPASFHISGSAKGGITSVRGGVSLRGLVLRRGKRLLLQGVRADALLGRGKGEWQITGRVSQGRSNGTPLLRPRDIPFRLSMDGHFRSIGGGVPEFAAILAGVPLKGSIVYRGSDAEPLSASLELAETSIAQLSASLPVKELVLAKGAIRGSLSARAGLSGDLRCDLTASVNGLRGKYEGRDFRLDNGSVTASGSRRGGVMSASGAITATGGEIRGKSFSASIPWRLAGDRLTLAAAKGVVDKTGITLAEMGVTIPGRVEFRSGKSIPLDLRFSGLRAVRNGIGAEGVSGEINAVLASMDGKRRLQGEGVIRAPALLIRNSYAGSLTARIKLPEAGGVMEVSCNLLEGHISASAVGDPYALRSGTEFKVEIQAISAARLSDLLGNGYPVKVSGGTLSLSAAGDFTARRGLRSQMAFTGKDLAFAGNGKTILNGGMLSVTGEWADGDLLVRDGTAALTREALIRFQGKLAKAASDDRQGDFPLAMAKVPVVALFDAFANLLPRPLQEAEATGSVALNARMRINGRRAGLSGELIMEGGGIEVPSQNLSIAALNGTIPFAMELGGKVAPPSGNIGFNRENYPKLLSLLESGAKGKSNFTIGSIRFGTTEFTKTRLFIAAGNGLTEIKSIDSGLFGGALLGRGYFYMDGRSRYGADILVHDLSLRELCKSYPAINGYMSGRVDGFVSLFNQGKGMSSLKGFMEFWSRSTSGEKMLVSKEFLQKLSGRKLKGMFFQNDRPYDRGEITAYMDEGYLTFKTLDIAHTNFLGIRDLSVSVAPIQNKISLDHLLASIREAASRGKAATGGGGTEEAPPQSEFKWEQ